jgi:hypothetical protein
MKEFMKRVFDKDNLLPFCFMLLPFMIILMAAPLSSKIATIHISHHYAFFIFGVIMMTTFIRNRWIIIFVAYACAWTLFILIMTVMHQEIPQQVTKNAFDALTFLFVGVLIYSLVIQSKIRNEIFYNLVCVSALIQAAIALLQFVGFDPILFIINSGFHKALPLLDGRTLTGTLGNNNFLAAYLAISFPFFFRKNWFYGLIVIIPCLILGNTSAAVIPAIIGTIFFLFPKIKALRKGYEGGAFIDFIWWAVIAGLMFSGTYYALVYHPSILDTTSETARWNLWAIALKQILHDPLTLICGFGPGAGWGKPFPMHNEWLQGTHQYGAIGLVLMAGYAVNAFRGKWITDVNFASFQKPDRILLAAFLIALINMLGNYSLHLAPSAFLIIIIAGLIERDKENG